MQIYIITSTYNVSQVLIDCAFQKVADAKAYAAKNSSPCVTANRW